MNIWLKTTNNRRKSLLRSFATSQNSNKSLLPVIEQSQKNQQIVSNSSFAIRQSRIQNQFPDYEQFATSKQEGRKQRYHQYFSDVFQDQVPLKNNKIFTSDYSDLPDSKHEKGFSNFFNQPLFHKNSSSSSNKHYSSNPNHQFRFSSTSSEQQIMMKRPLISEDKSAKFQSIQYSHKPNHPQFEISRRLSNEKMMTESVRILPSQRISKQSGVTNSRRMLTTGRKNDLREHVVSVIEYCSNEVGLACYNMVTGQIKLAQIIERMTYFRTISTIQRYYPQEIIYSSTLQHTPLIINLMERFKRTAFRPIKRNLFDETKGYYIYKMRGNKQQRNPNDKFLSFAALHALVSFLQNSFEVTFNYNALNIKWHFLEELLIIHSQTIMDLQIFLNAQTKTSVHTFVDNFKCLTDGGNRMLRANLLQPVTDLKEIKRRQQLTDILLDNRSLHDLLMRQLIKFKHYEPITAKFIQNPKKQNIRSLKSYLGAIISLSRMCFELQKLKNKLSPFEGCSPIINTLLQKLSDEKLNEIRRTIQQNFDECVLKTFQNEKTKNKKQNFIFLFKVQKLQDQFAQISRITYSHNIEDILKIFAKIKQKCDKNLKLLHNDFRGYYISAKSDIDLRTVSQKIQDDIVSITNRGNTTTFSTSILDSMNNRLKEIQKKLIFQSESLLFKIIKEIQGSLNILFQANYWISMLDMILSFSLFVKHYQLNFKVQFCKPELNRNRDRIVVQKLRTIWTMEKFNKVSEEINLQVQQQAKCLIIQKQVNSFDQLNILYSIGFLSILSQIGCLVPAHRFEGILFDTLISKMKIEENVENKMSHFQCQLSSLQNILQNSGLSSRCLILVDQVVKGTQPEQEWALSLAFLEQMTKIQGKSIILVSDKKLFKMMGSIKGTLLCQYSNQQENQIQDYGKEEKLKQCFKKYNFSPYFMDIYDKIKKFK